MTTHSQQSTRTTVAMDTPELEHGAPSGAELQPAGNAAAQAALSAAPPPSETPFLDMLEVLAPAVAGMQPGIAGAADGAGRALADLDAGAVDRCTRAAVGLVDAHEQMACAPFAARIAAIGKGHPDDRAEFLAMGRVVNDIRLLFRARMQTVPAALALKVGDEILDIVPPGEALDDPGMWRTYLSERGTALAEAAREGAKTRDWATELMSLVEEGGLDNIALATSMQLNAPFTDAVGTDYLFQSEVAEAAGAPVSSQRREVALWEQNAVDNGLSAERVGELTDLGSEVKHLLRTNSMGDDNEEEAEDLVASIRDPAEAAYVIRYLRAHDYSEEGLVTDTSHSMLTELGEQIDEDAMDALQSLARDAEFTKRKKLVAEDTGLTEDQKQAALDRLTRQQVAPMAFGDPTSGQFSTHTYDSALDYGVTAAKLAPLAVTNELYGMATGIPIAGDALDAAYGDDMRAMNHRYADNVGLDHRTVDTSAAIAQGAGTVAINIGLGAAGGSNVWVKGGVAAVNVGKGAYEGIGGETVRVGFKDAMGKDVSAQERHMGGWERTAALLGAGGSALGVAGDVAGGVASSTRVAATTADRAATAQKVIGGASVVQDVADTGLGLTQLGHALATGEDLDGKKQGTDAIVTGLLGQGSGAALRFARAPSPGFDPSARHDRGTARPDPEAAPHTPAFRPTEDGALLQDRAAWRDPSTAGEVLLTDWDAPENAPFRDLSTDVAGRMQGGTRDDVLGIAAGLGAELTPLDAGDAGRDALAAAHRDVVPMGEAVQGPAGCRELVPVAHAALALHGEASRPVFGFVPGPDGPVPHTWLELPDGTLVDPARGRVLAADDPALAEYARSEATRASEPLFLPRDTERDPFDGFVAPEAGRAVRGMQGTPEGRTSAGLDRDLADKAGTDDLEPIDLGEMLATGSRATRDARRVLGDLAERSARGEDVGAELAEARARLEQEQQADFDFVGERIANGDLGDPDGKRGGDFLEVAVAAGPGALDRPALLALAEKAAKASSDDPNRRDQAVDLAAFVLGTASPWEIPAIAGELRSLTRGDRGLDPHAAPASEGTVADARHPDVSWLRDSFLGDGRLAMRSPFPQVDRPSLLHASMGDLDQVFTPGSGLPADLARGQAAARYDEEMRHFEHVSEAYPPSRLGKDTADLDLRVTQQMVHDDFGRDSAGHARVLDEPDAAWPEFLDRLDQARGARHTALTRHKERRDQWVKGGQLLSAVAAMALDGGASVAATVAGLGAPVLGADSPHDRRGRALEGAGKGAVRSVLPGAGFLGLDGAVSVAREAPGTLGSLATTVADGVVRKQTRGTDPDAGSLAYKGARLAGGDLLENDVIGQVAEAGLADEVDAMIDHLPEALGDDVHDLGTLAWESGDVAGDLADDVAGFFGVGTASPSLPRHDEAPARQDDGHGTPAVAPQVRPVPPQVPLPDIAPRDPVTVGGWRRKVARLEGEVERSRRVRDDAMGLALDHITDQDIVGRLRELAAAHRQLEGRLRRARSSLAIARFKRRVAGEEPG